MSTVPPTAAAGCTFAGTTLSIVGNGGNRLGSTTTPRSRPCRWIHRPAAEHRQRRARRLRRFDQHHGRQIGRGRPVVRLHRRPELGHFFRAQIFRRDLDLLDLIGQAALRQRAQRRRQRRCRRREGLSAAGIAGDRAPAFRAAAAWRSPAVSPRADLRRRRRSAE